MGRDHFGTYLTDEDYLTAEKSGISKPTVLTRLRAGWNKDKAITEPLFRDKYREYSRYKEIAIKNGISKDAYAARVRRLGWGLEEAACIPIKTSSEIPKMRKGIRILTPSLVERAVKNGINYFMLHDRLSRGWDAEKATTHPPIRTISHDHPWRKDIHMAVMAKLQRSEVQAR